ncbi:OmpA family protein [Candidatus Albibeggiatoa sp. nov. NOAA]|uniref:OmpA family protein n=1 Tax=Candidatus Albibeggiatoa sp. nov. NOAA TaxID=3162724 RepID=UPI0032FA4034|nr:OmpA family protein [Thiotrichaceae bacterium]
MLKVLLTCGCLCYATIGYAAEHSLVSFPNQPQLYAEQDGIKYLYADFVFPFNSAQLTDNAKQFLDNMAQAIIKNQNRIVKIYLVGHTDSVGNPEYNLQLSKRRAQISRRYLQQQGVPDELLQIQGVGEKDPFASNDIYEGRERNRRVEITLAIH